MKKMFILGFLSLVLSADDTAINALKNGYNAKIDGKYAIVNNVKIELENGSSPSLSDKVLNGCDDNASLIAMMPSKDDKYPALAPLNAPLNDASRCRNYELLGAVYGASEDEVRANLTTVKFLDTNLAFNSKNGASKALKEVANELNALVKTQPELKKYLQNIGGTFKWRKIAGTNQLSAHSYGIAIDINVSHSSYWRWQKEYKNEIPQQIVHAFERHKFIWGGRWHHFDTMHFEYRPEFFGD